MENKLRLRNQYYFSMCLFSIDEYSAVDVCLLIPFAEKSFTTRAGKQKN